MLARCWSTATYRHLQSFWCCARKNKKDDTNHFKPWLRLPIVPLWSLLMRHCLVINKRIGLHLYKSHPIYHLNVKSGVVFCCFKVWHVVRLRCLLHTLVVKTVYLSNTCLPNIKNHLNNSIFTHTTFKHSRWCCLVVTLCLKLKPPRPVLTKGGVSKKSTCRGPTRSSKYHVTKEKRAPIFVKWRDYLTMWFKGKRYTVRKSINKWLKIKQWI